ncbi:threonine/serine exporter family protein [Paenibacillus sp. WLX1005]|uniref:threonine/serine exporter family protein n=1 Tax=Paenibacillus sp. WLX1005 TaxID=3243766 RepID=UPI003983EFBE
MYILAQLATSFIASAGFGILFNAPRRSLLQCGISGMLGWMVYILLYEHIDPIAATLFATFIVGGISQIFARIYKTPVIIFSVAGVIPLVPGGLAYNSMRHFVENNYAEATALAAQAAMLSGSIALGLVLSEVFNQMIRRAAR